MLLAFLTQFFFSKDKVPTLLLMNVVQITDHLSSVFRPKYKQAKDTGLVFLRPSQPSAHFYHPMSPIVELQIVGCLCHHAEDTLS